MQRVLSLMVALALASCNRAPTSPAEPSEFAAARSAVTAQLRDPDSARFGRLRRGLHGAVCGAVNARNGYGGYSGAMPFAWSQEDGVIAYDFPTEEGQWRERGRIAQRFAALGCSIGPDQNKAINALHAIEESDRRLEEMD